MFAKFGTNWSRTLHLRDMIHLEITRLIIFAVSIIIYNPSIYRFVLLQFKYFQFIVFCQTFSSNF